ncbi:MAG: hypothetical protein Q9218_002577 [Villophora microphyllina]
MKPASLRPFLPRPALRRRRIQSRPYAIQAPGTPALQVFDTTAKHLQRECAASNAEASRKVEYLRDEVASRLCERLLVCQIPTAISVHPSNHFPENQDINRHFPSVLDLGANACNIARTLATTKPTIPSDPPLHTRLSSLTSADWSPTLLQRDSDLPFNSLLPSHTRTVIPNPDTQPLPFAPGSFSAVLSSLSLHWINDLPSLLSQIATVLKPDSPFIAAIFGGDSLFELRTSLQLADLDRRGGVSTHVSPLADVRDVGGLLQRAGFKLLTVDVDDIVIEYPDTFALMADLQAMGEGNAALVREKKGLGRDVLLANEGIYRELHGDGAKGAIPATFRIIYMIGWTGGEGQPVPLERGSGMVSIKDVLESKGGNVNGGKK